MLIRLLALVQIFLTRHLSARDTMTLSLTFPRTLTLAAVLAAAQLLPTAGTADTVKVRYSVALLGLTLGTAHLTGSVTPASYRIEAAARLTGLASAMGKSSGAASASGAIANGRLAPATYATTAANSQETRTVRMAITGGAVSGLEVTPPFEDKPGRVPLTEAAKQNIVDPLGAVVMTVPAGQPLLGRAACDRAIPVFDGNTRFDVTLSFREVRHAKARGFDGDVVVCAARYTPLAGHRPDRKATKFMTENKDMQVWLAPVEGARVLLPFYISVATQIGTTTITAEEFSVTPGK